jgi:hypothetical protein
MSERNRLLQAIASTIADYRAGEIPAPTPLHVDRWIKQFAGPVQEPILAEIEHVLARTYVPKAKVESFLAMVVSNAKIAGNDPSTFWRGVTFLDIQGGGHSQRDMLALFSNALQAQCGFSVAQCGGSTSTTFVYLDDVIFTGNRVLKDITGWINSTAPATAHVHVITMGLHSGGQFYAKGRIDSAARAAGKSITLTWWRAVEIEDRNAYTDTSDFLRPTIIPSDPPTQAYVQRLGYAPTLRKPGHVGGRSFFSSEQGRHMLEQEFLKTGVHIRSICPNLGIYQRPLGNMVLKTTGFGSMLVTFRNCPNNAPLALWAGNPWYPLFARKTN